MEPTQPEHQQNPYAAPDDQTLVRPIQPAGLQPGVTPPMNLPALLSLIFSIVGIMLCQVFAVPGVICGHVALKQVRQNPHAYNPASRGLALAGTIVGYVAIAILALVLLIYAGMLLLVVQMP